MRRPQKRLLHPLKASIPIVTLLGILIDFKLMQSSNAYGPMLISLFSGINISSRLWHEKKACCLILFNEDGSEKYLIEEFGGRM